MSKVLNISAVFVLAICPVLPCFAQVNVRDFGAVGDGVRDDTDAIQAAIEAARAAQSVTVMLPAGVYLVREVPHPMNPDYGASLILYSHITLAGEGMDRTTIKRGPGGIIPDHSSVIMNRTISEYGLDHEIAIRDLTVDGNAAQNTLVPRQLGVFFIRATRSACYRVRAKNVRGTMNTSPGEGFSFEYQLGDLGYFEDCVSSTDDGGETSTGFSCDKAWNVTYVRCRAENMKRSMGFTSWGSNGLRYIECVGINSGSGNFHSEKSYNLTYLNCLADGCGRSYAGISPTSSWNVTIDGLTALNSRYGAYISDSPAGRPANITIRNSVFSQNRLWNIRLPSPSKNRPIRLSGITISPLIHQCYIEGLGGKRLEACIRLLKRWW